MVQHVCHMAGSWASLLLDEKELESGLLGALSPSRAAGIVPVTSVLFPGADLRARGVVKSPGDEQPEGGAALLHCAG